MLHVVQGFAVATTIYCAIKSFGDFKQRRFGVGAWGAVCTFGALVFTGFTLIGSLASAM